MYRDAAQWSSIRDQVLRRGIPIKQVARETGISRQTVRKMLRNVMPLKCVRARTYPQTGAHRATIRQILELDAANSSPRTVADIIRHLRSKEDYRGGYSAVSRYIASIRSAETRIEIHVRRGAAKAENTAPSFVLWKRPPVYRLIESDRAPKQVERTVLVTIKTDARWERRQEALSWMHACTRGQIGHTRPSPESHVFAAHLRQGSIRDRSKALAALAGARGIAICVFR